MRYSARWLATSAALLTFAALAQFSPVCGQDSDEGEHHEGFIVSFDQAKAAASEGKKDIFMEFTGSDWCPPCKALQKNVLGTEAFQKMAPEKFVLLLLDYPNDKSHQTPEEIAQNQKLQGEFKISGFPTIILADANGLPYAKMVGYGGTPAEDYLKQLEEKVAVRVKRDEMMAKAAQAEGAEKAKFLGEALQEIDPELAIEAYRKEIDQIIALDADNSTGMKEKFVAMIKSTEVKAKLVEIQQSLRSADDIPAALAKMDDLIEASNPEPALHQEILFMKAQLLFNTDKAKSKETLLAAQKLVPDSQIAGQITQIISQFFKDEE